MVNFRWFVYNKYGKFLTKKAKEYLSKKAKERIVRIRRQVVLNSDYSISLRAISINGENEKELEKRLYEFLNSNDMLYKIPFDTEGIEETRIGLNEDKDLVQGATYIELNIRGRVTFTRVK